MSLHMTKPSTYFSHGCGFQSASHPKHCNYATGKQHYMGNEGHERPLILVAQITE